MTEDVKMRKLGRPRKYPEGHVYADKSSTERSRRFRKKFLDEGGSQFLLEMNREVSEALDYLLSNGFEKTKKATLSKAILEAANRLRSKQEKLNKD